MLIGIKSRKILFLRHLTIGTIASLIIFLLLLSRPKPTFDVRLWRALGETAFIFLFVTLAIGPAAKLWRCAIYLIPWRRETGIWFAVLALAHFLNVFEFAFKEPGIELPRLLGLVALVWTLILALTSSDRAVNFLGISSWKWLHSMAYVIFYLVCAHATYFLFWRYPEANWFRFIFLGMAVTIPILQISAFIKEVKRQKVNSSAVQTKKLFVPIFNRTIIAEKTCEVSFDLRKKEFKFQAGQHIWVTVPKLLHPDPKGNSRVFSIATSPADKEKISIAFRDSGSGFKKTLMELPIGTLIEVEGPYGSFTLTNDTSKPLVFIAGGIGITPFLSMIRLIHSAKLKHTITLIYANRNKESAAYLDELENYSKQNHRFKIENKFGRIDEEFIRQSIPNLNEVLWYIVGPPPMVASTKDILNKIGISSNQIFIEEFLGY